MKKPKPILPPDDDRETWQVLVDAAEGALQLHSAKAYGLVKGGPEIDPEQCEEVLKRGKALGITPAPDCVERFIAAVQWDYDQRQAGKKAQG